jgi:hypothetical protein
MVVEAHGVLQAGVTWTVAAMPAPVQNIGAIVILNRVFEGWRTMAGRIGTVLMASAQPAGAREMTVPGYRDGLGV